MQYLVTGGAGFIGSNIVEELVKRGEKVRVLDNFSTGKRENLVEFSEQIELVEGDIRSYHVVQEAVDGIDVILHQAALPSVPRSVRDPITTNEVNVTGTLNVLKAAKDAKVSRVVYASSSSVYGNNPELPKHEGMIPNPLSPYAVSKLAAEKYCAVFSKVYGLETISLRYFNVFGPRQDPNSQYSAVIPKFIKAIMNGEHPVIYGDGEQSRDFTFVANAVETNLLAATADCESGIALNCACHGQITVNDLVEKIGRIFQKSVKPLFKEPRAGDVKHSFADIRLAEKMIRYQPLVDFDQGLVLTTRWFQGNHS
ncbi:MAG: SDR family oxidoreductase [Ignavibacteria bacterium]|nr:SDR family oxidoreductase [Ignavibacteria bacterium]